MRLPSWRRSAYTANVPQSIRVTLVEDQYVTREGLSLLIGGSPGFEICGQYDSMEDALNRIHSSPPDVLLADIGLPGISGIEGVRRIHELMPDLPILMLTVHEDSDSVFSAVCAGACGYLLKETPPARLIDVGERPRCRKCTEIPAAAQISRRVNFRRLIKVWISTRGEFSRGCPGVAAIAIGCAIDNVAAQTRQRPVLPDEI